MADHPPLIGASEPAALHTSATSVADLASVRDALRRHLRDADVDDAAIADVVLAASELATNALRASSVDDPVRLTLVVHPAESATLTVDNLGPPYPGRLEVDAPATAPPPEVGGRGLLVTARLGPVLLEGRIGGTRARFVRSL
jgi:anti-sigma regulatory factor (Ser/Thr protein kinase)